jgi:hypothetical protein
LAPGRCYRAVSPPVTRAPARGAAAWPMYLPCLVLSPSAAGGGWPHGSYTSISRRRRPPAPAPIGAAQGDARSALNGALHLQSSGLSDQCRPPSPAACIPSPCTVGHCPKQTFVACCIGAAAGVLCAANPMGSEVLSAELPCCESESARAGGIAAQTRDSRSAPARRSAPAQQQQPARGGAAGSMQHAPPPPDATA